MTAVGADGLRVGLVCPYSFDGYGGVQNHVLGLARHLRDEGHRPHVLAPGRPAPDLVDGLTFTSAGASVPVPYNGSVARVNFGPRTAGRVRHWLRSNDFDVLHIHEPITPSVGLLALWLAEVPIVATFHTATPRSRTMAWAGEALSLWIDKIGARMAVSAAARDVVVRYLGKDAAIVPNGVSHAEFSRNRSVESSASRSPDGAGWRGGDRPRITFLGRLRERRKGLDVLLAAVPAIRAGVPAVDVVVAGSGRRSLPPGVRSVGAIGNVDKRRLLASTDVFVAPHRERESFGVVLVEALASGADVVASDLPAFCELLGADAPGLGLGRLVPVGDPAALAAAVLDRITGRAPSAQPAAEAAVRRYDWSVVGAEITAVYRDVLAPDASIAPALFELTARSELR